MVHKLQDKLGHFSFMCQSRQEDGLQVCPDYYSNTNICSQKISSMDCNTFEVNNILSMSEDQDDTIDSLHNMHAENMHAGQFMPNSFSFNYWNMVYLQQFLWIMDFFQRVCLNSKIFLLEDAPSSPMDSFKDVSSKLHPLKDFQHCVSPKSLNLIIFQKRSFSLSLLRWPIWCLSIQPSPMILNFICDQILSEITTSIIFDIAKEEGMQAED